MKWKTKEGKEIEVKDMETSHIKNAIKIIEKNATITSKEYVDTGYDGDSYVPDFIKTTRKATKEDLLELSPIYKEMYDELKQR
jgi:hypothetical protein